MYGKLTWICHGMLLWKILEIVFFKGGVEGVPWHLAYLCYSHIQAEGRSSFCPSYLDQWGYLLFSVLCLLQFFPYNGANFAFQKQPCCHRPVVDAPMFSAPGSPESDPIPPQWPCFSTPTPITRLSWRWEVLCCLALPSPASADRRPYTSLLSVLLASPPWPKGPVAFVLACLKLHFLLGETSSSDICPLHICTCLSLSLSIASHLLRSSVLHN